jgi:prepilin-type processing-associated H-X9-DG protein/prepilin-type N-terminal cleavage/methylation domain-containing protein
MNVKGKRGFSLVEVMVVVSTVSVVMAVTMPAMNSARSRARAIVCRSNLRQLVLANIGYLNDHDGYYVPAADDFLATDGLMPLQGGYHRWHGRRIAGDMPFDPLKGPLVGYLANGKVKECPERVEFSKSQDGMINFERGCGGYGYNMQYLGSRLWQGGITTMSAWIKAYSTTANAMEVKRPAETLMFADTAFWQQNQFFVEYSFAESPYYVVDGKPDASGRKLGYPSPSIHFRHYGSANIGWVDGHVEAKPMAKPVLRENYTAEMAKMNIGWFEPVDNTLFDLE